jgi:DNA-binding NarL/FixJ family response regulator
MKPQTLLMIDDHDLFRAGVELLIRQHFPKLSIVSVPGLGSAIDALQEQPDVVLLDLNLNGIGGETALLLVRTNWPDAAVVVVTSEQDDARLTRIREDGSVRVICKSEPPQSLVSAIRTMAPGAEPAAAPATPALRALSPRQVEVLTHLRQGHSNKAIARLMDLSEFTVRGHVQQILKLTGATNRTNAVFLAEQAGLI